MIIGFKLNLIWIGFKFNLISFQFHFDWFSWFISILSGLLGYDVQWFDNVIWIQSLSQNAQRLNDLDLNWLEIGFTIIGLWLGFEIAIWSIFSRIEGYRSLKYCFGYKLAKILSKDCWAMISGKYCFISISSKIWMIWL